MSNSLLRLPKDPITEDRLPLKIGEQVSQTQYNTFIVRRESPGYKFELKADGSVFVVDMAHSEHEAVIWLLQRYFNFANGVAFANAPIKAWGQPFYDEPGGAGTLVAPDIAVLPRNNYVQAPLNPYPGPPPGDRRGNPHARVICEIAQHQSTSDWDVKCRSWLQQEYVRYVFGIKLHGMRDTHNAQGQNHRSMTARLWRQGAPPPGYTQWDFGTLLKHSQNPTECNIAGLPAFQVQIPTREIFWDPPILAGVPIHHGYNAVVPPTVVVNNINIDLYEVQQEVLNTQLNY